VMVLEGSAGELDKTSDKTRTHPTDAFGYYVVEEFPVIERSTTVRSLM
jgi:hypothetical protein